MRRDSASFRRDCSRDRADWSSSVEGSRWCWCSWLGSRILLSLLGGLVAEELFRTLAVAVAVAATAAAAAVLLLLLVLFELRRRPYGRRAAKEARRVCCWGSGVVVVGEGSRSSDVAVVGRDDGYVWPVCDCEACAWARRERISSS